MEFKCNIKAVPPLNTKDSFCLTNPSRSNKALITFSTKILSAFRLALDTFSIHSNVIISLSIIFYNLAANYNCCRKFVPIAIGTKLNNS